MYVSNIVTGLLALLVTGAAAAPGAMLDKRDTTTNIGLYLSPTASLNASYLQTLRLSYANTSAYLGAIKYQSYSEPLVVGNLSSTVNTTSFLSEHSAPTGYQQMYVVPHQSQPVGFSVPHGSAPSTVRTSGFSFAPDGTLLNNGMNLFHACQNATLEAINSYQIYWFGSTTPPAGMTCQGPIKIIAGDACSRY